MAVRDRTATRAKPARALRPGGHAARTNRERDPPPTLKKDVKQPLLHLRRRANVLIGQGHTVREAVADLADGIDLLAEHRKPTGMGLNPRIVPFRRVCVCQSL